MNKTTYLHWIGTFISFGISFYFYYKEAKEKDPTFIVSPIRSKLVDGVLLKNSALTISDSTGREIKENVYIATFFFFNQGKEAIERPDVLQGIKVGIIDGKIIDKNLLIIPRTVTELSLKNLENQKFEIDFKILEEGDGFAGQIIYSGGIDAKIYIEGAIKGVESFSYSTKLISPEEKVLFIIVLIVGLFSLYYLLLNKIVPNSIESNKKWGNRGVGERLATRYEVIIRREGNPKEKSTISFTYGKLLVLTTCTFLLIFIFSLFCARIIFDKQFFSNRNEIPFQIRK